MNSNRDRRLAKLEQHRRPAARILYVWRNAPMESAEEAIAAVVVGDLRAVRGPRGVREDPRRRRRRHEVDRARPVGIHGRDRREVLVRDLPVGPREGGVRGAGCRQRDRHDRERGNENSRELPRVHVSAPFSRRGEEPAPPDAGPSRRATGGSYGAVGPGVLPELLQKLEEVLLPANCPFAQRVAATAASLDGRPGDPRMLERLPSTSSVRTGSTTASSCCTARTSRCRCRRRPSRRWSCSCGTPDSSSGRKT